MDDYVSCICRAWNGSCMKFQVLKAMERRMNHLKDMTDRDFAGGSAGMLAKLQEVKYWKEAIERGEFDAILEGRKPGYADLDD